MGAGRDEGVDADGFIVSGADIELIPPLHRPLLESCVSSLLAGVEGLVAVYLYGSVATGRASSPDSDVDLFVVTDDNDAAATTASIKVAAANLTAQFGHLVREVGIAHITIAALFADDIDALGSRCFIKHYCVALHGEDIASRLPAYRPSATMAWAFNHNIGDAIERARQQLDHAASGDDIQLVCRAAARKVLLAAASLASVITTSWTTDRRRGAAFLADTYREWAIDATTTLEWTTSPTDDRAAVRNFLDGFATWVAQQLHDHAAPRRNQYRPVRSVVR
jgi:hypothetical protein